MLLVRLHGEPLDQCIVEPEAASAGIDHWLPVVYGELNQRIVEHLNADGLAESAQAKLPAELAQLAASSASECASAPASSPQSPSAVLAICTMGTHRLLPSAITHLLDQDYQGRFDVVIVDNNPSSGAAARVIASLNDSRVRLVPAPIPGLSFARNVALATAVDLGADLLFYTDDDALADPTWVSSQAELFQADANVAAVTGLVVPGSQLSEAEQLFEEGSGFNKGYQRTVWSMAEPQSSVWSLGHKGDGGILFPFAAGSYGSGNSIAFRTDALLKMAGFDEALGAGTLTQGGEDLDIFVRVLMSGATIVYQPRAVIRHYHRETMEELRKQMVNYGAGLSAFLFREFLFLPGAKMQLLRVVPAGLKRMFDSDSEKNESRSAAYPEDLAKAERRGFFKGPYLYVKSRRNAKKLRLASSDDVTG